MPSLAQLFTFIVALVFYTNAQTIIPANDPRIEYSQGDWSTPSICRFTTDGKFEAGMGGCYNLGTDPCTTNFTLANKEGSTATLKFKGASIAVETLSNSANAPTAVTFTLDGEDTVATLKPDAHFFTCPPPLFSKEGLSTDTEHTLTVVLRVAPNSDVAEGALPLLMLKQFTIGGGNLDATSTTGTNSGSSTGTSASSAPTGSQSPPPGDSASNSGFNTPALVGIVTLSVAFFGW